MKFFENATQTRQFWTIFPNAVIFAMSLGLLDKTGLVQIFAVVTAILTGIILFINLKEIAEQKTIVTSCSSESKA